MFLLLTTVSDSLQIIQYKSSLSLGMRDLPVSREYGKARQPGKLLLIALILLSTFLLMHSQVQKHPHIGDPAKPIQFIYTTLLTFSVLVKKYTSE